MTRLRGGSIWSMLVRLFLGPLRDRDPRCAHLKPERW